MKPTIVTVFDSGLWWAEIEFDGQPVSASGITEKEAVLAVDAKYQELLKERDKEIDW